MRRRRIGWLLTAASVVLPVLVSVQTRAYVATRYEVWDIPIEGKAVASMFMLLVPVSVVFASIGIALGVSAYRALERPRPDSRLVELFLQTLPVLSWLFVARPLFYWVRSG